MGQFELPAPVDDGLFIPDVGLWSKDKHHFLRRYLHAFTEAMKKKNWDSLHYVDLFAGAGIERLRDNRTVFGLDWGSALIAAQMPAKFHRLHLVETDRKRFSALFERLKRFPSPVEPQLINGDANSVVDDVVSKIPTGSLSVAFLDPYGLNLHFSTLAKLSSRKVDLIIYFPDRVDVLRNWGRYEELENSELDRFLGGVSWREKKKATAPGHWVELLTALYVGQIKKLGYIEFEQERIKSSEGNPLYKLIFCSRDPAGGKIWRNVARKKPSGQDSFYFT